MSGDYGKTLAPAEVHTSHDMCEEGYLISDPVCQKCRRSAAYGPSHEALRVECDGPPLPVARSASGFAIPAQPSGAQEAISKCTKCGAQYPSAPPGYVHKCGRCSGGMCKPIDWDAKRDFPAHPDFGKTIHLSPIPTDQWWAQRWIDKATPGEIAAMRALLFGDDGK